MSENKEWIDEKKEHQINNTHKLTLGEKLWVLICGVPLIVASVFTGYMTVISWGNSVIPEIAYFFLLLTILFVVIGLQNSIRACVEFIEED